MTEAERFHRKHLQKAAELSRTNLDELTPIQRERLRLDLTEFHMSAGLGMRYQQTESDLTHEELSRAYIPDRFVKAMVEGLRGTFAKFAEVKDFPLRIKTEPKNIDFAVYLGAPSTRFHLSIEMEP